MSLPPRTMPLKAVVLDLDDTLYPEREFVRSGYQAVEAMLRERGITDEPVSDWLWARALGGVFAGAYDAINEHFQLELTDETIQSLVTCYRNHTPRIASFADVPDVLRALGERFTLGLLSDGVELTQGNKLASLDLPDVFDATFFTLAHGRDYAKPSALGFEAIAESLGVPHEACCYVGDNVSKDFVAPNALGWLTVRLVLPGQIYADKPVASGGGPAVEVHSWGTLGSLLLEG
jgi:putative hydrolase of the HAD superfamily